MQLKISDSPFDLPVPNPDEEPYVDSSDDSSMMDRDENSSLSKSRKRKREGKSTSRVYWNLRGFGFVISPCY